MVTNNADDGHINDWARLGASDSGFQSWDDEEAATGDNLLTSRAESVHEAQNMTRAEFIQAITAASAVDVRTNSRFTPALHQSILRAIFVEHFFPKHGTRFPGFDYIVRKAPSSDAVSYAIDTAHCLLVGQVKGDLRLRQEARKCYSRALSGLCREIARPDANPGYLISCVHILQNAEIFIEMSEDGSSWRRHAPGTQYAIMACKGVPPEPEVQSLFSANIGIFALWDALLQRRAMPSCRSIWAGKMGSHVWGSSTHLNEIAMGVAGLLEESDRICSEGNSASQAAVQDCVVALSSAEGELHAWITNWYSVFEGLPYWAVSAEDFAYTLGYNKGDAYPQRMYAFPHMQAAMIHRTYTLCLLAIRSAQLDVYKSVTKAQYPFRMTKTLRQRLAKDAGESADNLLMSIPYLIRPSGGYVGISCGLAPLQFAYLWYTRRKDAVLVDYCERIAAYLENLGFRCPWSTRQDR